MTAEEMHQNRIQRLERELNAKAEAQEARRLANLERELVTMQHEMLNAGYHLTTPWVR